MKKYNLLKSLIKYSDLFECLELDEWSIIKADALAPEAELAFCVKPGMNTAFKNMLEKLYPNLFIYNAYLGEGESSEEIIAILELEHLDKHDERYDFLIKYQSYTFDVLNNVN